jgi:hypothetical protein
VTGNETTQAVIPPEALGPGAEGNLPAYIIGFR